MAPKYKRIYEGESFTFTCHSDFHVNSVPIWLFSKGTIKNASYIKGSNKLKVESAQIQMSGRYSCFGFDSNTDSYFVSHVYLLVFGKVIYFFRVVIALHY